MLLDDTRQLRCGRQIQAGQGQRHQLGEVLGQKDQGAFGKHVLDGVDDAVVDDVHTQNALIAGIAQFVGKQQGEIERRELIDVLVSPSFGLAQYQVYYGVSI